MNGTGNLHCSFRLVNALLYSKQTDDDDDDDDDRTYAEQSQVTTFDNLTVIVPCQSFPDSSTNL